MGAKRVLFVGPCKAYFRSFMEWDLEILKSEFDVRPLNVCFDWHDIRSTLATPFGLISGVAWADVVFCWFASREAFPAIALAQLYNKKTVVVVGGSDVTAIPEVQREAELRQRTRFARFLLNKVTQVLPYSKDAEKGVLQFLNEDARVRVIYLGVDATKFRPSGAKKEEVITVGVVSANTLRRKGLETFVKSATYLPEVEFIVIGNWFDRSIDYLRSIASKNVRFMGLVEENELIRYYQEAKVYAQVSAHEAFGVSLAEAMACECVPVVTDKGAIPEVVGDTGFYVPYEDPASTAEGIKHALRSANGTLARQRIETLFSLTIRREALLDVIREM